MKQIQPFQKHWLQLTSIVVCRIEIEWHIYASVIKYAITGSNNGLPSVRHQTIIQTISGLSSIEPLGKLCSAICKIASILSRPQNAKCTPSLAMSHQHCLENRVQ